MPMSWDLSKVLSEVLRVTKQELLEVLEVKGPPPPPAIPEALKEAFDRGLQCSDKCKTLPCSHMKELRREGTPEIKRAFWSGYNTAEYKKSMKNASVAHLN